MCGVVVNQQDFKQPSPGNVFGTNFHYFWKIYLLNWRTKHRSAKDSSVKYSFSSLSTTVYVNPQSRLIIILIKLSSARDRQPQKEDRQRAPKKDDLFHELDL